MSDWVEVGCRTWLAIPPTEPFSTRLFIHERSFATRAAAEAHKAALKHEYCGHEFAVCVTPVWRKLTP